MKQDENFTTARTGRLDILRMNPRAPFLLGFPPYKSLPVVLCYHLLSARYSYTARSEFQSIDTETTDKRHFSPIFELPAYLQTVSTYKHFKARSPF